MRTFIKPVAQALCCASLLSVVCGGSALAHTAPPETIPGLDTFSLPSSRPTPQPSPTPAPTTRPSETPTATPTPRPLPIVRPTPRPAPTPTPTVAAPPVAIPTPGATPTPAATPRSVLPEASLPQTAIPETTPSEATLPEATPMPLPAEGPVATPTPVRRPHGVWNRLDPTALAILALVVALLALGGLGWWWRNRPVRERAEQRRDARHEVFALGTEPVAELPPTPVLEPAPPPVAPLPTALPAITAERAMLELELVPKRAGTNLLSASVEYSLAIRNTGALAATGVRLDIRLLSAGPEQDAILDKLFAEAITQPITPPFDLPPESGLTLDGMVMHPKETLTLLDVTGQALFVPVLAVNVRYGWEGGDGRTARSYVVGMVRGEGTRLQPFRRDGARMFETVAVLDYSIVLDG